MWLTLAYILIFQEGVAEFMVIRRFWPSSAFVCRRHYEQIHRRDAVGMIAQKGLPALRRRLPSPGHVFCHGGLPDIDAKLEQFAMDSRCSPKRVRDAHVANELANVSRCLWPAAARS